MVKELIRDDKKSQRRRKTIDADLMMDRLRLVYIGKRQRCYWVWVAWVAFCLFNTVHVTSKLLPRMRLRLPSFLFFYNVILVLVREGGD